MARTHDNIVPSREEGNNKMQVSDQYTSNGDVRDNRMQMKGPRPSFG